MTASLPKRPLHIVHTESSCGWGGQEIRILNEAEGMIGRGHRVEIWAVPESNILGEAQRRGIPHAGLSIRRKNIAGFWAMRRALKASRPDVVNTHSSTDAWLVALAGLTLRAPPPVVRTRHISAPTPINRPTHWLYCSATRHIVVTGDFLRRLFIQNNRFPAAQITSVPTGIDLRHFAPGDCAASRRALGLAPHGEIIGIVATLRSWKGHRFLIAAFAQLRRPGARLLIVGDGPMRAAIERQIDELGLRDVTILTGNQANVLPYLQAMDVFVLPSYANEGVPQAILQAMACGIPVVSTSTGAIPEVVRHEATGIIVEPENVEQLRDAIAQLLAEPARRTQLATHAAEAVRTGFSAERMLDRMEAIFYAVAPV